MIHDGSLWDINRTNAFDQILVLRVTWKYIKIIDDKGEKWTYLKQNQGIFTYM